MTRTPTSSAGPARQPEQAARRPGTDRTTRRLAAALVALIGAVLVVSGILAATATATLRGDGLTRSAPAIWSSPGYAVQATPFWMHGPMMADVPAWMSGHVEVTAQARAGGGVFVGLARSADVESYLTGVARSTVRNPGAAVPQLLFRPGAGPPEAPETSSIWVASASGTGPQTIDWDAHQGGWTLVVMNDDGSAPVSADVATDIEVPVASALNMTIIVIGLVAAIAGGVSWAALSRPVAHTEQKEKP